jgi:hypothetical protein
MPVIAVPAIAACRQYSHAFDKLSMREKRG